MSKINKASTFTLGQRRAGYIDLAQIKSDDAAFTFDTELLQALERADLVYRTLCAILYNFVPQSGHPGGSISSGRIVQSLLFNTMDYDLSNPDVLEADMLSYAAGHKAMGLYASWALRNEYMRIAHPDQLASPAKQLRLEDLLGFRRNPITSTPLFKKYNAKPLDGHPTPATPFIRLATGASGVGVGASFGLALGAMDHFSSQHAPWVHVLEGEGGMTPGRVHEALAFAATARLHNIVMHLDWNQASIDSNRVCRDGANPGDYVQWTPAELFYLHDWNVINVPDGLDFRQVLAAQKLAMENAGEQPTAIIYRTVKGWKYGIEGRGSHGAGHAFCSDGYYAAIAPFEKEFGATFPRFSGDKTPENLEKHFFDSLMVIRTALEQEKKIARTLGNQIAKAKTRLAARKRVPGKEAPRLSAMYADTSLSIDKTPIELTLKPGQSVTLRGVLGDVMSYLNKKSRGAVFASAADLLDSTSLSAINKGFPAGFYNATSNPGSRILATGGICEDAMGAILAGVASFGHHIGVGSSYGAFIAALQHVAARLHAIGQQTRSHLNGEPQNPFIIVCGHAGPKTGEDGPTHADPQALQLLQENFPKGSCLTLTPWDGQEIWPLMLAALKARPAVIAPFVTRPAEPVVDREKYSLPPASAAAKGVYAFRKADPKLGKSDGTIVLQGNGVATIFVTEVLPALDEKKLNLNVFYVASADLFDLLPEQEQRQIFPDECAREAMGITEFTFATLHRWIGSEHGRQHSLHPFRGGHFLGSGQGAKVFEEAGLHGKGQLAAVMKYLGKEKL